MHNVSSVDTRHSNKRIQQTTDNHNHMNQYQHHLHTDHPLALASTIQALLNSYLRETKQFDPKLTTVLQNFPLLQQHMIAEQQLESEQSYTSILIQLPFTERWIQTGITYDSLIGQHHYIDTFVLINEQQVAEVITAVQLIDYVIEELSHYTETEQRDSQKQLMRARIQNSLTKMEHYYNHHLSQHVVDKQDYIYSEQSLIAGHPFHPFPKSSEGFSLSELSLYSPEMGASFQLYYLAVHSAYMDEHWLHEQARQESISPAVRQQAQERLGSLRDQYHLLPMHPWQVNYIQTLSIVQQAIQNQHIILLGSLGDEVYPTSSVRTVWNKQDGRGYKLPLHIRITNLIRENTTEQAQRTIDAARIIDHQRTAIESSHFKVLTETGYSSVKVQSLLTQLNTDRSLNDGLDHNKSASHNQTNDDIQMTLAEQEQWTSAMTVIYRPQRIDPGHTYVVASLLEKAPHSNEPKLISVIRQGSADTMPDLSLWLSHYTEITLLSLLRVFADYGISFEAHLQNSLISLKEGLPACYYVRDLEGVSIDRTCPAVEEWIQPLIEADSHVLYDSDTAWLRTQYYFVVNHLGSLIHTIAHYEQCSEQHYWNIVQQQLIRWNAQAQSTQHVRLSRLIESLLHVETLPAKANFISCFQAKGDQPSFLDIPNPLYIAKR